MKELAALFVGDQTHGEFQIALEWLQQQTQLSFARDLCSAEDCCLAAENGINLIVLAAARPGEFLDEEINHLRQIAPLARIVSLLGSWCEGELRSGYPWPGVYRIYWHQWPARVAPEIIKLRQGGCPVWGQALTMTPSEEVLHMAKPQIAKRSQLVAIHASNPESASALRDACQHLGYATICAVGEDFPDVFGVIAVVWDVAHSSEIQVRMLPRLVEHYHSNPILATASFPRRDMVDQLLAGGVHRLLSKPFFLHDFSWLLKNMIDSHDSTSSVTLMSA